MSESILEKALLEAEQLEETMKSNAKEILSSTMKEEINELVKESLSENDYLEEQEEEEEVEIDFEDEVDIAPELELDLDRGERINKENTKEKTKILKIPKNQHYQEILAIVALQYLAYQISVAKGINPDKPRNLAKVVTVE